MTAGGRAGSAAPGAEADAIVLAGGRSARLGGVPKAALRYDGTTLLRRTVDAVGWARRIVVVGDAGGQELPDGVLLTREEPAFAGPAAAIAAGMRLLADPAPFVLVLACDLPRVDLLVPVLRSALEGEGFPGHDGAVAVDEGRLQPLTAVYRSESLLAAVESKSRELVGCSVFGLISELRLLAVDPPEGAARDVDTWTDAAAFGIVRPTE